MKKAISAITALMLAAGISAGASRTLLLEAGDAQEETETAQPAEETAGPTQEPAIEPSEEPAAEPTQEPAMEPSAEPTEEATDGPVMEPSEEPAAEPTQEPAMGPTAQPYDEPTAEPTEEPTEEPTVEPTAVPQGKSSGGGGSKKEEITVYMTVEKLVIGEGYIYPPTAVTVSDGATAAYVLDKVIGEGSYKYTGEIDDSFYLAAVYDSESEPQIPSYIAAKAGKIRGRSSDEWLGEFDYTSQSGWMCSVNNKFIKGSASEQELSDGDVIRWQFTIYGYGSDIGADNSGFGMPSLKQLADKTKLIRLAADMREAYGDKRLRSSAEYIAAQDVLVKLDSSQSEVNDAYSALSKANFDEAGNGGARVKASLSFEGSSISDGAAASAAVITTSADSLVSEIDKVSLAKLAKEMQSLTIRAADAVVTVPKQIFEELIGQTKDGITIELSVKDDSIALYFKADDKVLDTYGIIEMDIPYDAGGYDDCIAVSGGESYEYSGGRLRIKALSGRELNVSTEPVRRFKDVEADAPYAQALNVLMRRGIIMGVGDDRFEPDAPFTAGMLAAMLCRGSGNEPSLGRGWYAKPMEWAYSNGYIPFGDSMKLIDGETFEYALRKFSKNTSQSTRAGVMTRAEAAAEYVGYFIAPPTKP